MSESPYIITGIKAGAGPNGAVPVRQEIEAWSSKAENQKQVNLFLLALRRYQDVPPSERDSFFQVAGIHGMPYKLWDEPETSFRAQQDDNRGYCTHANYLFPPWHRPYLLLFEQQLYEIMINQIVPQFPANERQAWQEAANTWRLPFWDWAANPKVPSLATSDEVTVTAPPGVTVRMDNPLYKFQMPNDKKMGSEGVGTITGDEDVKLAYGECYATSRCPTEDQVKPDSKDWAEGVVNNDKVREFMGEHISVNANETNYGAAAEMVYRLLSYPLSYEHFSTVAITDEDKGRVNTDINIEFIHNNIHYWTGGDGGHMSQIPVATFDPIFWLHHWYVSGPKVIGWLANAGSNIDRIFAIWQQLNPDKWFTEGAQAPFDQKIIGIDPDQKVTNTTPLRPFRKEVNRNWTPDEVRNHFALGYTYPEIQPWKPENQTGGQADPAKINSGIRKVINNKYGQCRKESLDILDNAQRPAPGNNGSSPATAIAVATSNGSSPATAIARAYSTPASSPSSTAPVPGGMKITADGRAIETNDFAISVRYSRFAFGGHPFNIQICLAPADSSQPRDPARDHVANVYNFSSPATIGGKEVCSNCTTLQGQNLKVSSYVPVNPLLNKLLKEESLSSLDKETVSSVLQRLYWRVVKYGKEVPADQQQSLDLQIVVSVSNATHHKDPFQPSGFDEFEVIPSLGHGAQDTPSIVPSSTSSDGNNAQDPTQRPSSTQYLALDKTIKLKKPVPPGGSITVNSASINLEAPANIEVDMDSTGISFMYLDESRAPDLDLRDEENYEVLLSISLRRKDRVVRLNSKRAQSYWGKDDNYFLNNDWFRSPTPKIKAEDAGNKYCVYIDDNLVAWREKNNPDLSRGITHVQYWFKDRDQTQTALSYALTVDVS